MAELINTAPLAVTRETPTARLRYRFGTLGERVLQQFWQVDELDRHGRMIARQGRWRDVPTVAAEDLTA